MHFCFCLAFIKNHPPLSFEYGGWFIHFGNIVSILFTLIDPELFSELIFIIYFTVKRFPDKPVILQHDISML